MLMRQFNRTLVAILFLKIRSQMWHFIDFCQLLTDLIDLLCIFQRTDT